MSLSWDEREKKRKEAWKKMKTGDLIDALCKAHIESHEYRHSDQHFGHEQEIVDELNERFAIFDAQYQKDHQSELEVREQEKKS